MKRLWHLRLAGQAMLVQMQGSPHALPAEEMALEMTPAKREHRTNQRNQRRKKERSNQHEHHQGMIPHDRDHMRLQLAQHLLKRLRQQNLHHRRGAGSRRLQRAQAAQSLGHQDRDRADFQVSECALQQLDEQRLQQSCANDQNAC